MSGELILKYQGGPQSNHIYLYKREAKGRFERHRKEGKVTTEAKIGVTQPKAHESWKILAAERS